MKQVIRGAKLARMQTILDTQTDKQRFANKIKERFVDAVEVIVVDPTGINFHYFPRMEDEDKAFAMARPPLSISKLLVEQFNAKLVEDAPEEDHDFDSVEVLVAQLNHWVDTSITKADVVFTADDIVELTTAYGLPDTGKFIYQYTQNGLLDPSLGGKQKRFSNYRSDIQEKTLGEAVVVTSLIPLTVTEQIAATINGEAKVDGSEALLFPEDILLPVTHLKDGQTYRGAISSYALDFYGQIDVKVKLVEEVEQLFLEQIKFSYDSTWSSPDIRYKQHINEGDQFNILIMASGITKPFAAKLFESYGEGQFASITGAITLHPGLNVIPYTAPSDIIDGQAILAVVNKEALEWADENQTVEYSSSRTAIFHKPAIVPIQPVISGPSQFPLNDAITVGIPMAWTNSQMDYSSKIIDWVCDVDGATLDYNDPFSLTAAKFTLPNTVQADDTVTITLTTDGGTATKQVKLMGG